MLALSLSIMGTLQWFALPRTTTQARSLLFALVGLILGLWGYRLASGTWVGSSQVPHRATALAGLLFLIYFVRAAIVNAQCTATAVASGVDFEYRSAGTTFLVVRSAS
jgi:hypothetical protein